LRAYTCSTKLSTVEGDDELVAVAS
jgi:hypothetical protein